jgi:hypothetical protein
MPRLVALLFATTLVAVSGTHPAAAGTVARERYVDPFSWFTTDAQFEAWLTLRARLAAGFDDICGDTFCEGDWSNITALRFQCSVQQHSGRIGRCAWSFAASNEDISPANGTLDVQVATWTCPIPLVPGTTMEALLAALSGDSPLHAALPGSQASIYDALAECL